jgi:hypothetical protein
MARHRSSRSSNCWGPETESRPLSSFSLRLCSRLSKYAHLDLQTCTICILEAFITQIKGLITWILFTECTDSWGTSSQHSSQILVARAKTTSIFLRFLISLRYSLKLCFLMPIISTWLATGAAEKVCNQSNLLPKPTDLLFNLHLSVSV